MKMKPFYSILIIFLLLLNFIYSTDHFFLRKDNNDNKIKAKSRLNINNYTNSNNTQITKKTPIQTAPYEGVCYSRIHGLIYDLSPMGFNDDSLDNTFIDYNFCRDIPNYCHDGKRGLIVDKVNCIRYAGEWTENKDWRMIKFRNGTLKVILDFPEGDKCPYGDNENYQVSFELFCNPNINQTIILNQDEFDTTICVNKIQAMTPYACPVTLFVPWYRNLIVNKYLVMLIVFGLGIFLTFYGLKFKTYSMTLILGIGYAILFNIMIPDYLNIHFTVNLLIGLLVAFLNVQSGAGVNHFLALILGSFITLTYFLFINQFSDASCLVIFNTSLIIAIALCLFILAIVDKYLIVFASSFIGSYAIIRSLSLYFGGFPDEVMTINLILRVEDTQLAKSFGTPYYYYIVFITLFTIAGIIVQSITRPKEDEDVLNKDLIEQPIKKNIKKKKGGKKNENIEENKDDNEIDPELNNLVGNQKFNENPNEK